MSLIDDREEKVESAGKFWLALFSSAWILFLLYLIFVQHGFCLGAVLLPFSGFIIKRLATPSELMARVQVPIAEQAENMIQKNARNAAVKRFNRDEEGRRKQETTSSAAGEIVKRLGVIEGYIRVLEAETDSARRTLTFQGAHQEITEISAKRASGEIPSEVLRSPDVLAQAKSTSDHLVRLGLADDPLNTEIVRLFSIAG
jgi:hypothetical protein